MTAKLSFYVKALCGVILFATLVASCTNDNWDDQYFQPGNGGNGGYSGGGTSRGMMSLGDLSSFTVELNSAALSETETIPTSDTDQNYNDYIENNFSAKATTKIAFNGTTASVTNKLDGDTIDVEGANVEIHAHSKGFVVEVSGETTNGSLKIYSEKKFELLLNGVSIANPDGSAVNIQNGNCFVVLQGENTLTDGSSASYTPVAVTSAYASIVANEDSKAVMFSEDNLRFSGTGLLTVKAQNNKGKAAISSDDAIFVRPNTNISITCGSGAGNGIKANDDITLKGGVLNIQTAAAGSKGLSSDGRLDISGGRITAITTGGVDTSNSSNPSGCAAIKADSVMTISGGEVYLKSTGQGGKGISCDEALNISGGTIHIITEGSQYGSSNQMGGGGMGRPGQSSSSSNSVSPKGIRGDKDITISGGEILVRTSGSNGEGIESKATLTFTGGKTAVSAYDDGMNASKAINVTGGYVFSISNGQGDGIDSNGSISATGGTMIGVASTLGSEEGIDLENSTFKMSNANVISIGGGMGMGGMGMGASYSGHYVSTTISGNVGSYVALCDGDKPLIVFALPRQYSNGSMLLSAPSLGSGTYTLKTNVTPTGGTFWMNLYEGATSISNGSSTSVTAR